MGAKTSITIKRQRYRPNPKKFRQVSYDRVNRVMTGAIRAFIKSVAEVLSSHISSGMTMGSLIPLARTVNAMEIAAFSSKGPQKGFTTMDGGYERDRYKNITEGIRAGKEAFKILRGSPYRPVFRFEFTPSVYQYIIHEFGFTNRWGQHVTAWYSMTQGQFAFLNYLDVHQREIAPEFREFMIKEVDTVRF